MLAAAFAHWLDANDTALTYSGDRPGGNVFVENEPTDPDFLVVVYGRPGVVSADRPADRPGLQAIVRADPYAHTDGNGRRVAAWLGTLRLDQVVLGAGTAHEQLVEGLTAQQSEPIPLGRDARHRPRWSVNFLLSVPAYH